MKIELRTISKFSSSNVSWEKERKRYLLLLRPDISFFSRCYFARIREGKFVRSKSGGGGGGRDGKIIELDGFSKFVPRSVNRGAADFCWAVWKRKRGPPPSPLLPRDAASSRSAANGADSIIIIKFNWHGTPWPIVAVALNGLDFLPGLFSLGSFLFRFASGLARLRGMGLLRPVEDELSNIYTIYSFNRLSYLWKLSTIPKI